MTPAQAAVLGVVQGLTEFLPVSSSAHLILARAMFGWEVDDGLGLAFDIACHVGTLLAVLFYFRHDIGALVRVAMSPGRWTDPGGDDASMLRAIVVATLPLLVLGLVITVAQLPLDTMRTMTVAGVALGLGGVLLLAVERVRRATRGARPPGVWEALSLGAGQALAVVPGVSRAGAVMAVAMLLGWRRERAARLAFLLGVPAIGVSAGKAALDLAAAGVTVDVTLVFVVGIVSSGIVGYGTVKYFIRYVSRYSLDLFAAYRLVAGAAIVWSAGG